MTIRKRTFSVLIFSTLTALFCSTVAHANLITSYTTNVGGGGACGVTATQSSTIVGADCTQLQITDFTWSITLPKFDTSLGTLQSVTIYFYENTDVVTLSATNNSGSDGTLWLVAAVKPWAAVMTNSTGVSADRFGADFMTLYDSTSTGPPDTTGNNPANFGTCALGDSPTGGCTGGVLLTNGTGTGNLGGYSITNTDPLYTGDPGYTFATGTGAATSPVTGMKLTDTTHTSSYSGPGNFTLSGTTSTLFTGQFSSGGGAGTISFSKNIQTQLSAEVDYSYTATPEPTTMGLMGSALIGIAVLGKKIRRKQ